MQEASEGLKYLAGTKAALIGTLGAASVTGEHLLLPWSHHHLAPPLCSGASDYLWFQVLQALHSISACSGRQLILARDQPALCSA